MDILEIGIHFDLSIYLERLDNYSERKKFEEIDD